jgi:hypothetical protein
MAFQLDQVVPLGRSFEEYVAMFALTEDDLQKRILGCGDGPASFNAEVTSKGGTVVSIDPLYECEGEKIRERIDQTFAGVMDQVRVNAAEFVWRHVQSVDELAEVRMGAMRRFLMDYATGKAEGRYVAASLPVLDFPDRSFDLGLSSHFLFLYSQHLDLDFHIASIEEMLRVCAEVRIIPLLQLGSEPSPHVEPVVAYFKQNGFAVEIGDVPYEFQQGGNRMLSIAR